MLPSFRVRERHDAVQKLLVHAICAHLCNLIGCEHMTGIHIFMASPPHDHEGLHIQTLITHPRLLFMRKRETFSGPPPSSLRTCPQCPSSPCPFLLLQPNSIVVFHSSRAADSLLHHHRRAEAVATGREEPSREGESGEKKDQKSPPPLKADNGMKILELILFVSSLKRHGCIDGAAVFLL